MNVPDPGSTSYGAPDKTVETTEAKPFEAAFSSEEIDEVLLDSGGMCNLTSVVAEQAVEPPRDESVVDVFNRIIDLIDVATVMLESVEDQPSYAAAEQILADQGENSPLTMLEAFKLVLECIKPTLSTEYTVVTDELIFETANVMKWDDDLAGRPTAELQKKFIQASDWPVPFEDHSEASSYIKNAGSEHWPEGWAWSSQAEEFYMPVGDVPDPGRGRRNRRS